MPVLELDGRRIHYIDQGDGTPILWIHGYPLSSRLFERQLAIPRARHIVPDLPGFGASDPPTGDATLDDYARDLVRLLDELSIDRAVVAGVSMGGYIVFAILRLAPERVRGVILIDTRETPDTEEARKGRMRSIEIARERGVGPIADEMLPKMLTPATLHSNDARVEATHAMMKRATREGVVTALYAMAHRPDSTENLRQIRVPTLIAVGTHDGITPPSDAQRMKENLANATLVEIDDAAHLSNLEQAGAFNRAVEVFLRELP
ncbi:MAG TPA: alpha/beta fold hydrolase [Thermoanaerobaculia bacterium]